jgi:hypothetical protein
MAELDQFNVENTTSLDAFQDDTQLAPPVTNASSNQNLASHAAMLSPRPDQMADVFNTAMDEYNTQGSSPTAESVITNAKGENAQAYRRASMDFLLDANVSDEWKRNAIGRINDPNSDLYRVRAMVGTQEASKAVPGESQESADMRGVWASSINKVLDFQREKQKFYNEMQLRQDANKAATYVDIAESFIPVTYGYKQSSLANDLSGGTALSTLWQTILPGEAKSTMVEKFNQIPFEQRAAVMQKAMDIIAEHGSTIILPEESDQANMSIFRDMVESGEYTLTHRVADNVIGVLDSIGLLSILRAASKAGKAAGAAGEAAGDAIPPTGGGGSARRPTWERDWREGRQPEPGVYNQEGQSSYAVAPTSTEVDFRNWHRNFAITDVQPTSPSQVIRDANPDMARRLHLAVEQDVDGTLANAAYGTSRQDAIAHDIAPQVAGVDGTVSSKVSHPEKASDFEMMANSEILDFVDNSGAAWLTPSEKRVLRGNVINDFQNAVGMVNRKEMTTIDALDDGVKFSAVYGPSDSGWSSLKAATDQAQYALREYGVTPDSIKILIRNGDDYKELPYSQLENVGDASGDFLLKIDHEYKFDASALERDGFEALDVKNNFVDRWFPGGGEGGHGTFQSSLLDPQSLLSPKLTKGATIGGLRGAQLEQKLLQSIQPYVKSVKAMNKQEQGRLFDKIKEANYKGESFNYANLRAEGFTENQITALNHWKQAQDTLYHISNSDLVKTYRTRGFGLMVDEGTGTRLLVKDLPKGSVSETVSVFDPITDSIIKMDKEKLARHYEAGGTVARTASPLTIDGVSVTHVLNQNKPGSTFIRSLNHTDTLLNYRKGYYAVRYKDPHFIEKRVLDEDGKPLVNAAGQEVWRAVATSANIPDAKKAIERLSVTSGGEYRFRNNLKGEDFDLAEGQSMISGGMSAQRVRGQRLEEALGNFNVSEAAHIESPMESLIRSIASISERVSMRDYMETAKRRFVAQFDDVLPRQNGQAIYPKTRSEIGREGMKNSKMAADARSTWEYLRQLENGYINIIDDGWKASFNAVADIMGHRGFGTSEANLRSVGKAGPSQVAKATAFNLLIAANPIRQFLIQSHQVLMLGANFPRYTFMHMADDITLMSVFALGGKPSKALLKFSGRTEQEAEAMWKALSNSGISAGISKHDFVQQSLTGVADAAAAARRSVAGSVASKAFTGTGAVFRGLRKVGFDAGEWISSSASFLAHYDEAVRAGRKMSQEAIDDITTKSRNYVFNMDKAGAMPWNHNSWAIITQFIQQPYKAILQFTTNRQLTTYEKLRTATFMVMMFGTHSIIGAAPKFESIFENYMNELLPEDGVWREAILRGVESLALNTLFTKMYGEKVELDYSSISPLDSYGLFEFMSNISDKGIREIIAGTPSGSLLFGTNPRLMNLAKSLTTMMGISASKYDGDPVGWSNVAKDAAGLLSGASNAMKAAYALEYGRKIGALGGTTDSRVNSFEAIAQVLGIQTLDEKRSREIMDATWTNAEKMKQDVQLVFSQVARHMTQDGITPDQFEYVVAMSQAMMSSFKGNPVALDEFRRLMNKQAADKNYGMMNTILTQCGFMSRGDMLKLINKVPNITEEQRRNLIEVCNASTPLDKR